MKKPDKIRNLDDIAAYREFLKVAIESQERVIVHDFSSEQSSLSPLSLLKSALAGKLTFLNILQVAFPLLKWGIKLLR